MPMEASSHEELTATSQKDGQNVGGRGGRGHTQHSGVKFKYINIKQMRSKTKIALHHLCPEDSSFT